MDISRVAENKIYVKKGKEIQGLKCFQHSVARKKSSGKKIYDLTSSQINLIIQQFIWNLLYIS
jgi:hypothetical protein